MMKVLCVCVMLVAAERDVDRVLQYVNLHFCEYICIKQARGTTLFMYG